MPFPSTEGPTAKANGISENDITVRVNRDDAGGKSIMCNEYTIRRHSCT